jgi:KDO2-lipid IV(A) lauroyltransferase
MPRVRPTYLAYRGALAASRYMSPRGAHLVSWIAGSLAALIGGSRRAMFERHVRRVRPDIPARLMRRSSRRAFQAYARYYVESFRLPRLSRKRVERGFSVEGFEYIEQAIARGNGAILALPHLGGWEWAGRWLADRGYDVHAVAEVLGDEDVTRLFVDLRARLGMTVIALDDSAGVKVASALRSNAVVCLLCDRDIARNGKRSGVEVNFFGESTSLPSGPAFFALRTGAALLPVATYFRRDVDGHHAVVGPPVDVTSSGSLREDVRQVTQRLAERVEELIGRRPEQWHLFQPNWPSDPGY